MMIIAVLKYNVFASSGATAISVQSCFVLDLRLQIM